MKKQLAIALTIALLSPLAAAVYSPASSSVYAAVKGTNLQMPDGAAYYGEVKNGLPNGKGTMQWGPTKQYWGEWVNGKRSGQGKYINQYVMDGEQHKIVYNGSWQKDKMQGQGTRTNKVTTSEGNVRYNQIQTGTFSQNLWTNGYEVIHAVADPDYSFTYKNGNESLHILGSNGRMTTDWAQGGFFEVTYAKGSLKKYYTQLPVENAAAELRNKAALKYLQSIQSRMIPVLQKFKQLSNQLPLN
ncbi:hypothetical protein Q5741_02620 [Paenibacillus sp. JX-17]|uniref:MORN repeat-containing protein n=1 Tax=Paenibacillus lacisoli TaxID=3064525 RepID=A0ABT9CC93_9BACL|nr:hypothetical protein [Paenibacillus sp. JX-17]MDO7905306.1 hypothetical protein [Paenibacillus sp. JX-17]